MPPLTVSLKQIPWAKALLIVCIAALSTTVDVNAQATNATNTFTAARFLGWGATSGDLLFKTNNITRLTLKNTTGYFGIGTTTPSSLFSIGSLSQFQVDASGNLMRINNVPYSFPSAQGAASTFLRNDGAGNLSWSAPSIAWGLSGNAGTAGTNFIGTTDNVPFSIRVNNRQAGRIDNTNVNTFFGYEAGTTNTTGTANTANGQAALFSNTTGTANTANGVQALYSNTTGAFNTASGMQTLNSNTSGTRNTANGYRVLFSNTTGNANTASGYQALYSTNTGSLNTAIGSQALSSNITGNSNTANGFGALSNNTTGNENTAHGYNALSSNLTGRSNTALGAFADVTTDSLNNATVIGYNAKVSASSSLVLGGTGADAVNVGIGTTAPSSKLHVRGSGDGTQLIIDANPTQSNSNPLFKLRNSTGTDLMWIHSDDATNVFVGLSAGRVNNAIGGGLSGTFVGSAAGYSNTIGRGNTANGHAALYGNTTGSYNTATGQTALFANTTGGNNTATGVRALYSNTTGSGNTANGDVALLSNTTGTGNTAIGDHALNDNTTGSHNVASGYAALYSNVAGNGATAIGLYAMRFANSASTAFDNYNVAVGYEALTGSPTAANNTGNFNTALGSKTLVSNTTGHNNTATGGNALYSNATGSNNTALGFGADVSADNLTNATAVGHNAKVSTSNSLVLGGTGADAVNVGIGTTAPMSRLDVQGAISGFGIVPIGSIVAWHKSFNHTPGLPAGWVECNGQRLNDSTSVFHGDTIPNLNGHVPGADSPNQGTPMRMFLRGDTTSGAGQKDAFQRHRVQSTDQVVGFQPGGGGLVPGSQWNQTPLVSTIVIDSDTTYGLPRTARETRPVNMSVVWIMRVK